jgi:hypothetical protein
VERTQQRRPVGLVVLVVFVAVAGLLSGAATRFLLYPNMLGGGQSKALATQVAPTATRSLMSTATATNGAATPPSTLAHFSVSLVVSPKSGPAGSNVTITATATIEGTHAPMQGLTCRLQAPVDGAPGLFATWPSQTATDSNGIATWSATVPSVTPGTYYIEVYAQTPSWSYRHETSFTVTPS